MPQIVGGFLRQMTLLGMASGGISIDIASAMTTMAPADRHNPSSITGRGGAELANRHSLDLSNEDCELPCWKLIWTIPEGYPMVS